MNVRVKIDAPAGLVELEGDREFVSTYLDKLLPIVEAAGFGRASLYRALPALWQMPLSPPIVQTARKRLSRQGKSARPRSAARLARAPAIGSTVSVQTSSSPSSGRQPQLSRASPARGGPTSTTK